MIPNGQTKFGGVVSRTVTLKLPLVVLPALSVAEHETLVTPKPKVLLEAGVQLGITLRSTTSKAETL